MDVSFGALLFLSLILAFLVGGGGVAWQMMRASVRKAEARVVELQTELLQQQQRQLQELQANQSQWQVKQEQWQAEYALLLSQKKSSEVRWGTITEKIIPFFDECPYSPEDMLFLGRPIDYLVFDLERERIVFLEVKGGKSRKSPRQSEIKRLIDQKRVYFEEMIVTEKGIEYILAP